MIGSGFNSLFLSKIMILLILRRIKTKNASVQQLTRLLLRIVCLCNRSKQWDQQTILQQQCGTAPIRRKKSKAFILRMERSEWLKLRSWFCLFDAQLGHLPISVIHLTKSWCFFLSHAIAA